MIKRLLSRFRIRKKKVKLRKIRSSFKKAWYRTNK